MDKTYDPSRVEDKWYTYWSDHGLFHADPRSPKPAYSIVIPPPNVTGILHIGHALNNTIQDILIRWKRMSGFEALWMPGTDHAGIATQNVVERELAREGQSRHALGREEFIKRVWQWKDRYHATITGQLRKLGSSCDWERERFTMDEGLSRAVRAVFVRLYNEGLIYRGKYIINWCPRCHTALSDEEAEHKDVGGKLYHFRYPLKDGSGFLTVATTRPETMLGDTAVAVNPKDGRYTGLVGATIVLPIVNREIPVIADDFVDREFGTGAVKVTPAHDPNDFAMGKRHNMEPIIVMDEKAQMCGLIPEKYLGLDRFTARKLVVEEMEARGLVEKIEEHQHAVGHCYRCQTMIEPYYSDQWFVRMKPLAQPALAAVKEGRIRFHPERWEKTYIEWMENIRDWCISRQIWWGHRVPVWYCNECEEMIVTEQQPLACPRCPSSSLRQDEDVLDTWFSSWLWPFSTMGWPESTAVLDKFYPTDTLVTAPEILFFWVARMIMAGLHFTEKLPFTEVVLHGTVRDKTGRKMSKSLGNSIDPLEIISVQGADALRFSMIMITAQGADVFLAKDTFDIGRNFGNKLWNASRFLLGTIDEPLRFERLPSGERSKPEDRWIVSRLHRTIQSCVAALSDFRFNEACHLLYDFTWGDYCDWYIEMKKPDLYQKDDTARRDDAKNVCAYVLAQILKLLHPVMPFITEEIWSHLREKVVYPAVIDGDSIMRSSYPVVDASSIDDPLDGRFGLLREVVTALRTIRAENNIPPEKKGEAVIIPDSPDHAAWLESQIPAINLFARLSKSTVDARAVTPSVAGQSVVKGIRVYLLLEGLIDRQVEIGRLVKEITRMKALVEATAKRLNSAGFADKAPPEVVQREREKHEGLLVSLRKLEDSLAALERT